MIEISCLEVEVIVIASCLDSDSELVLIFRVEGPLLCTLFLRNVFVTCVN